MESIAPFTVMALVAVLTLSILFWDQAPRRWKQPPQSESAMLEPRRESQDIAELKAEVSTLKAEIRAGRS